MADEQLGASGVVGVASKLTGALVGAVVVAGKRIALYVRGLVTGWGGLSGRTGKKPAPVRAKKKTAGTGKKTSQTPKAKVKRKARKRNISSRPQNPPAPEAAVETGVAVEEQGPKPPVAEVGVPSDRPPEMVTPTDSES
jgi:hypothetical protein